MSFEPKLQLSRSKLKQLLSQKDVDEGHASSGHKPSVFFHPVDQTAKIGSKIQTPDRFHSSMKKSVVFVILCLLLFVAILLASTQISLPASGLLILGFLIGTATVFFLRTGPIGKELTDIRSQFESLEDRAWELSEREARYRKITDTFGDLVVVRDDKQQVIACNAAYAKALGTVSSVVIEKNLLPEMMDAGDDKSPDRSTKKKADEKPKPGRVSCEVSAWTEMVDGRTEMIVEMQGQRRWFHWLDVPTRDEKSGAAITLSVARDITSFKLSTKLNASARKQAEEASRAKSRFLAMASHEMRTPLNGIIGMTKLLDATNLTAEQKNYSAALRRSGQSLLHQIEGMLDLTTIEAGRFVLKPSRIHLCGHLENIIELMYLAAADKGLELALYTDPSLPEFIKCDGERLRQILINLIGNAIKFTAAGGVILTAEKSVTGDKPHIHFRVHDTGAGLKEGEKERIFEEFERVDDLLTRRTDGVGLGLSISRALAQEFGGTLRIEETSPMGSTFLFSMPFSEKAQSLPNFASVTLGKMRVGLIMKPGSTSQCLSKVITAHQGKVCLIEPRQFLTARRPSLELLIIDADTAIVWLEKHQQAITEKLVVLLTPSDRSKWPELKALGAHSWLMLPVRESSLLGVLLGEIQPDQGELDKERFRQRTSSPALARTISETDEEINSVSTLTHNTRSQGEIGEILVAEDNDVNALLVTSILEKAGYKTHRVFNGQEAVERVRTSFKETTTPIVLVLMDMHMPVLDGVTAIRKIRELEVEFNTRAHLPICMLTADDVAENLKAGKVAGADKFLPKPLDPAKLIEAVNKAIQTVDAA